MPVKRHVTAGTKKLVAGRQRYTCAANVENYVCPLAGQPFDEAGYEIDHVLALKDGGTNDASNLQALCLMCHRVKSNRSSAGKPKPPKKEKEKGFVYTGPTLSDSSDSEEEPGYKEVMVNGRLIRLITDTTRR
jgi:5-methylcytosine-specific restriction endonuclease McrA